MRFDKKGILLASKFKKGKSVKFDSELFS